MSFYARLDEIVSGKFEIPSYIKPYAIPHGPPPIHPRIWVTAGARSSLLNRRLQLDELIGKKLALPDWFRLKWVDLMGNEDPKKQRCPQRALMSQAATSTLWGGGMGSGHPCQKVCCEWSWCSIYGRHRLWMSMWLCEGCV